MKIVEVSKWVVPFLAVAGYAAFAISACTSSGNDPVTPDAGPDGPTADPGSDADAASGDGGADAGCESFPMNIETLDAGALFGCYQAACAAELAACAPDCVCNGVITTGLECLQADAGSAISCFYPPIMKNVSNLQVRAAGLCMQLVLNDGGCERAFGTGPEGGDEAGQIPTDAAADAGDAAGQIPTDAAADAGGTDSNPDD
jgi:hypothetical protein